jgi:type VI secretion system secreted protein VgrG
MGFLSRSKDGTPDNANALRFEDKAGEEQVWIQAQKNMDTHVKADATHVVGKNYHHYVGENEEHRVEASRLHGVKVDETILTGSKKTDAAVDEYVLASGTKLRLVCGDSAIELTAAGHINMIGKGFNIFVEGDGYINTSKGKLNLNDGSGAATSAPGAGHKNDIHSAVEALFPAKKGSKGGAPKNKTKAAVLNTKNDNNFSKISPVILKNEGGFVNDPDDSGGATNKGIAWATWKKYAKEDLGVEPTLGNLKNLTTKQAEVIYQKRYWGPSGFAAVKDPKLALMTYDWSITSSGAGKQVQKLLNSEFGQNVNVDGAFGPKTIQAMNNVTDSDKLTNRIAEIRKDYYNNLAQTRPANAKFLKGWLNRVDNCLGVNIE